MVVYWSPNVHTETNLVSLNALCKHLKATPIGDSGLSLHLISTRDTKLLFTCTNRGNNTYTITKQEMKKSLQNPLDLPHQIATQAKSLIHHLGTISQNRHNHAMSTETAQENPPLTNASHINPEQRSTLIDQGKELNAIRHRRLQMRYGDSQRHQSCSKLH